MLLTGPLLRQLEVPDIQPGRIRIRDVRRVARDRIIHIRIMKLVIAVGLPARGYDQIVPGGGIRILAVKTVLYVFDTVVILELPTAV
ncbi:hypothetical protein D3C71_1770370 [compost metagenome]